MATAGTRRVAVTVEQLTQTGTDPDTNTPINSWAPWRSDLLVEVRARRGAEFFGTDNQRYSQTIFRLIFDYFDAEGLDAVMRIQMEGRTFDIKNIMPDYTRKMETIVEVSSQDNRS